MAGAASSRSPTAFPTVDSTDFSGAGAFYFDLVRLQQRQDIPRGFLHRHNYYHLLWMSRAEGTHVLDFEHYAVRDHAVFFLSPGQVHAWSSTVRPEGFVLNISTDFFAQMFPRADDVAKFPFFHLAGGTPVLYLSREQHDAMVPLLHEIEREIQGRELGRFDVVRSYLLILLTHLRRVHPAQPAGAGGPGHELAKRFTMLIEKHYLQFDTVRQYADSLNVTERQLNEALKRTAGRTANQLVQDRLVLEAKRLLSNTQLSVAEVAFELNFEDPAYFARFVKKHTGCTPGELRSKYSQPLVGA